MVGIMKMKSCLVFQKVTVLHFLYIFFIIINSA